MQNFVHLAIDVTREWCDPTFEEGLGTEHTHNVAQNIASAILHFRNAAIQNIIIYYDDEYLQEGFKLAGGGPYLISENENDIVVPKFKDSGFAGNSELQSTLSELNAQNLVVSGFDAGGCLLRTVRDALSRGYQVTLLTDLIGQSQNLEADIPEYIKMMESRGAVATTSKAFFSSIGYELDHGASTQQIILKDDNVNMTYDL